MLVAREDGTPLRGDVVLKAVQRRDLAPIPSTLELVLRADSSFRLAEDDVVLAGSEMDRYRVVHVRSRPMPMQQDGDQVEGIQAIALLDACHRLSYRAARAVVKERRLMGEIYRACGATAPVAEDFTVLRFVCLAGEVPTFGIARALQEEAAVPVWGNGRLSFKRLPDLFKARPAERLATDTTQAVESGFMERHEIPFAMSTDAAGAVVLGNRDKARSFVFLPRTPLRNLNNMTRCLVVDKVLQGQFAGHLTAGDVLDVAGELRVVVTAAHSFEGGDTANQASRLWLGRLEG